MYRVTHKIQSIVGGVLFIVLALLVIVSCTKDSAKRISDRQEVGFSVSQDTAAIFRTKAIRNDYSEEIGIIPMACRFDGAISTDSVPKMCLLSYVSDIEEDTCARQLTKGAILTKESFKARYQSAGFGVFAYLGDALRMGSASTGTKVAYNRSEGVWSGGVDLSDWGDNKMSFYAYAPLTAPDGISMVVNENNGNPTISYTIPSEIAQQIDLRVAKTVNIERPFFNTVPLTFTPALTAVVFKLDPNFKDGKIVSIALRNLKGSGRFDLKTQTWTLNEELNDYALEINKIYTAAQAQDKPFINNDDEVMFMMPQSFQDEASIIEVKYAESADLGTIYTFTAPLNATRDWKRGKQVTYAIAPDTGSVGGGVPKFEVGDMPAITYAGIVAAPITVISQLLDGGNGSVLEDKVPWSVAYSMDEGRTYSSTAPDWLTVARNTISGNVVLTVNPQTPIDTVVSTSVEWERSKGTANAPYNLSNQTNGGSKIENTANCYIINGPGRYRIPLVYGNAIKQGSANLAAYSASNNSANPFMNCEGKAITSPYIRIMQGGTPQGEIVWQDEQDLITDVNISGAGENSFLTFQVSANSIQQGNAVVAVKINGAIAWSWHIWVTGYKMGVGDVAIGSAYTFMPVNLGWCGLVSAKQYNSRACMVKFTQSGTGISVIKRVVSNGYTIEDKTVVSGNNAYYQWGRKDPFPGSVSLKFTSGQYNYKDAIQAPDVFYLHSGDWCVATYYNSWNSAISGVTDDRKTVTIKTIYDPSPVGYCVPNSYAFEGLPNIRGDVSFFAAGGRSYSSGSLIEVGNKGYYWSACSYADCGYALYFDGGTILQRDKKTRAYGFTIRSMKESGSVTSGDKEGIDVGDYLDIGDLNPDLKN